MGEIYEWLYDEYAEAALCQEPLFQDHVLEEVLAAAPEDIRLGLFDQVAGLRLQWCTAAFARGLQLGLALGVEQGLSPEIREACPRSAGRTAFSFSRASSRSPWMEE